jgi:hypothetical protein
MDTKESQPPKKRGRPRKADIMAKKVGNIGKGKVGRPPGDAARINELKARLLGTTGDKVINKIVEIALSDDHPGQMAALKLCADRVLPLSYFEKDKSSTSKPQITINISSALDDTTKVIEHTDNTDYIEYTDAKEDEEE